MTPRDPRSSNRGAWIPVTLSLVVAFTAGCRTDPFRGSREPLPRPEPEQVRASDYEPAVPYREIAGGLFSRTRFVSERTELRYLLVGPRKATERHAFERAALVIVMGGTGTLEAGAGERAARRELVPGASFTLRPREPFRITNQGDTQMDLDATLFRTR